MEGGGGVEAAWVLMADGSVLVVVEGRGRSGRGSSANIMDGPGPSSLAILVMGTGEEEKRAPELRREECWVFSASSISRRSRVRPRGDSDRFLDGDLGVLTSIKALSRSSLDELGGRP